MFIKIGPKHASKDEIELAVFEVLGKFQLGVRDLGLRLALLGSKIWLVVVGHTPRVLMQGRKNSRRRTPGRIPLYSY
jgi:hypothetical protein